MIEEEWIPESLARILREAFPDQEVQTLPRTNALTLSDEPVEFTQDGDGGIQVTGTEGRMRIQRPFGEGLYISLRQAVDWLTPHITSETLETYAGYMERVAGLDWSVQEQQGIFTSIQGNRGRWISLQFGEYNGRFRCHDISSLNGLQIAKFTKPECPSQIGYHEFMDLLVSIRRHDEPYNYRLDHVSVALARWKNEGTRHWDHPHEAVCQYLEQES